MLAFCTMFLFPVRPQIRTLGQTAHDPVDVVLRDGLQDDAAELVLQDFDLGASLNPMLAAKPEAAGPPTYSEDIQPDCARKP